MQTRRCGLTSAKSPVNGLAPRPDAKLFLRNAEVARTDDLVQMMPEMHDIVLRDPSERCRLVFADRTGGIRLLRRQVRNHMSKEAVVGRPQFNQKLPVELAEALEFDQLVLFVSRKNQIAGKRGAHEALVIVGGGVEEMTQNLFL